jgi:hypothetical protein
MRRERQRQNQPGQQLQFPFGDQSEDRPDSPDTPQEAPVQDEGMTPGEFGKILWQGLSSGKETRPQFLKDRADESLGISPGQPNGGFLNWRNWARKLKPF